MITAPDGQVDTCCGVSPEPCVLRGSQRVCFDISEKHNDGFHQVNDCSDDASDERIFIRCL